MAVLGQVAKLMSSMMLVMAPGSVKKVEVEDEMVVLMLRKNVVTLGAASQLMFDMTLQIAQDSHQE